ncbi:MAG: hypothetical protein M3T49_02975 [Candidatus Eremiobacteraeota bacterium]|nr:hypothetical protein [Candidatus Eremiobacteraeota bacterium]
MRNGSDRPSAGAQDVEPVKGEELPEEYDIEEADEEPEPAEEESALRKDLADADLHEHYNIDRERRHGDRKRL